MLVKIILFISTTLPILINYYLQNKYKILKESIITRDNNYYHHLFITRKNELCREHTFKKNECGNHCSYSYIRKVLNIINSSKKSILICMYSLTVYEIFNELAKAHNRGVIVRIITDPVMTQIRSSKLQHLRTIYGVEVKVSPLDGNLMHHKFCLIDEKDTTAAKLLMGSLNMTLQGITLNFDFMVLTNNTEWIQRYSQEFEELWQTFK